MMDSILEAISTLISGALGVFFYFQVPKFYSSQPRLKLIDSFSLPSAYRTQSPKFNLGIFLLYCIPIIIWFHLDPFYSGPILKEALDLGTGIVLTAVRDVWIQPRTPAFYPNFGYDDKSNKIIISVCAIGFWFLVLWYCSSSGLLK